jgi:thiamine pyrophosphate-dependent acetolactate synthase large subunit-like protein
MQAGDLNFIGIRNEEAASIAASAFAKPTGSRLSVWP